MGEQSKRADLQVRESARNTIESTVIDLHPSVLGKIALYMSAELHRDLQGLHGGEALECFLLEDEAGHVRQTPGRERDKYHSIHTASGRS